MAVKKGLFEMTSTLIQNGLEPKGLASDHFIPQICFNYDFFDRVPLNQNDIDNIQKCQPADKEAIERLNHFPSNQDFNYIITDKYGKATLYKYKSSEIFIDKCGSLIAGHNIDISEFFDNTDNGNFNYESGYTPDKSPSDQIYLPNILAIKNNLIALVDYKCLISLFEKDESEEYSSETDETNKNRKNRKKEKPENGFYSHRLIGYIINDDVYFKGKVVGKIAQVLMKYDMKNIKNCDGNPIMLYAFSDDIATYHNEKSTISSKLSVMRGFKEEDFIIADDFGMDLGIGSGDFLDWCSRMNYYDYYFCSTEIDRITALVSSKMEYYYIDKMLKDKSPSKQNKYLWSRIKWHAELRGPYFDIFHKIFEEEYKSVPSNLSDTFKIVLPMDEEFYKNELNKLQTKFPSSFEEKVKEEKNTIEEENSILKSQLLEFLTIKINL